MHARRVDTIRQDDLHERVAAGDEVGTVGQDNELGQTAISPICCRPRCERLAGRGGNHDRAGEHEQEQPCEPRCGHRRALHSDPPPLSRNRTAKFWHAGRCRVPVLCLTALRGRLRYVVCDVFTDEPLAGNQVAVFTDARGIPEEKLQPLAKELNLSETTFIYPPRADGHVFMRIFTPAVELPFAGHPTLGTAFVLGGAAAARRDQDRDRARHDPGPARARGRPHRLRAHGAAAAVDALVRTRRRAARRARRRVAAAGRDLRQRRAARLRHARVGSRGRGVAAGHPAAPRVRRRRHQLLRRRRPALEDAHVRPRARDGGGSRDRLRRRTARLHLARHGRIAFGDEIEIVQGVEIGRPSKLFARVEGSADAVERIEVGGSRSSSRAASSAVTRSRRRVVTGRRRSRRLAETSASAHRARRAASRPELGEARRAAAERVRAAGGTAGSSTATTTEARRSSQRRHVVFLDRRSLVRRSLWRTFARARVELWNGNSSPQRVPATRSRLGRALRLRRSGGAPRGLNVVHCGRRARSRFVQSIQATASTSGSSSVSARQNTPPVTDT